MASRTSSIYRKTKSYFPIVFIRMMMQMLSFKIENRKRLESIKSFFRQTGSQKNEKWKKIASFAYYSIYECVYIYIFLKSYFLLQFPIDFFV